MAVNVITFLILVNCKGQLLTKFTDNLTSKRGIVIYPSDIISLGASKWIDLMDSAELNILGIHANGGENLSTLKNFLESKEGNILLEECKKHHIACEFETHALQEILPRDLFDQHPEYFRMDETGVRQKNYNMCFSSEGAYQEIEKNIREITKWLKPSTNRYFFWTDDVNNAYCHCDSCKKYTESEQSLIYENKLLSILRKINPSATLAHLAYHNTYSAPVKIKPLEGIFLEYAPINRNLSEPMSNEDIQNLMNNLNVFPKSTAHVLEYWLDVSKYSGWDRNKIVKIPWNARYCERDVALYARLGFKSITTFGAWIDQSYVTKYGEDSASKVIVEYGSVLKKYVE